MIGMHMPAVLVILMHINHGRGVFTASEACETINPFPSRPGSSILENGERYRCIA